MYQILPCYSCDRVTFYQFSVHTGTDPEYIDRSYDQTLFPSAAESPMGLPPVIQREWDATISVRRVSANGFAVLLGRVTTLLTALLAIVTISLGQGFSSQQPGTEWVEDRSSSQD
jgi:hypothetical protein